MVPAGLPPPVRGRRLDAGELLVDLVAYSEEREKYLRMTSRVLNVQ